MPDLFVTEAPFSFIGGYSVNNSQESCAKGVDALSLSCPGKKTFSAANFFYRVGVEESNTHLIIGFRFWLKLKNRLNLILPDPEVSGVFCADCC
ncbi:hypothetical protein GZ78_21995 [Endozoicomonas numazuensis]|uniref:Uncharacterized protein n=1 Tax=Endozoicomonas numazuensis TaxID=1137799 RepID=A0A081NDK1_9GAMM|nr:hypothetical protein GZ78_21995 [Endozoicomonas numazuensis]